MPQPTVSFSSPAIDYDHLENYTPAMRQFLEIKKEYRETLVLYRMGDFYETFFDDAIKAHRLIGITLTKRGKTAKGLVIPMAGIPSVSLDQYVARLVALGESVVIVEQFGEASKAMTMQRRVARIITPGTLTDANLLPEKRDAVLLALCKPSKKKGLWGLVWLTLSNGSFYASLTSEAELESEISRIAPSEVLVAENIKHDMRERFSELTFTSVPIWHFDEERGQNALKTHFSLDNLDAWNVGDKPEVLAGANALLDYIEETQVDVLPFIQPLQLICESEYVVIDAASRRNLEICDSMRDRGSPTLLSVLDHCQTTMGSRELRRWLNEPLRDINRAAARHEAIEELLTLETIRQSLKDALSSLPDIERITSRIALGSVRPKELASLRDAFPAVSAIRGILENTQSAWFSEKAARLSISESLFALLSEALLPEPSTLLREGDVIRSEYNEELQALRAMRDNSGQFLADLEARERIETGINNLRVEYNRVAGFYIEVSKGQASQVPARYQRRQTLKNVERYLTPELKQYENQALSAKERAASLEKELYDGLVKSLLPQVPSLINAAFAIAAIDTLLSLTEHAIAYRWVRPELSVRPGIEIKKSRHPVVETTIETYVPNDCQLVDGRRCLIITGPNMGGKSTYMRSIALIALLAWAGSFVPAQAAKIGPIDRIHTRIGASDDLARGRSTFMVEMTEAAAILHQATDRSLVLMDEIGRGTATFDGLSLAASIAQELVERTRSFTLFATHYFELTELSTRLKEVTNVHVSASQSGSRIVFLHEISEGPASQSYGIAVAQLAGVPAPVVRRARAILARLEEGHPGNSRQPNLFSAMPNIEDTVDVMPQADIPSQLLAAADFTKNVASMDVDNLSPRDALMALYELKTKAAALEHEQ